MRNSIDLQFEKLLEFLGDIGLNQTQIECAEDYLMHGEENALKQLPEIDFTKLNNSLRGKYYQILEHFKRKGREEGFIRCFNLLFAMGNSTLYDQFLVYGLSYRSILNNHYYMLLDPIKLISLYTEKQSYLNYHNAQMIEDIISLIKKSSDSPEQVLEKVKSYHKSGRTLAMIFVYCAYFKLKEKSGCDLTEAKTAAFLKEYEDCFLNEINDELFRNQNAVSKVVDLKLIKDFIGKKQKNPVLSPEVSSIIKKYHMDSKILSISAGCAFYNISISYALYNFLSLCLHSNTEGTLNSIQQFLRNDPRTEEDIIKFSSSFIEISEEFSLDSSKFLYWVVESSPSGLSQPIKENILKHYVIKHNEEYIIALKNAQIKSYGIMMKALKKENVQQAEEILKCDKKKLRMEYMHAMMPVKKTDSLYKDVFDFICGKKNIDVLYLHQQEIWSKTLSFYYGGRDGYLHDYITMIGRDDTLKRLFALSCFAVNGSYNYSSINLFCETCKVYGKGYGWIFEKEKIKEFFADVDSIGLGILYQLNAMGRYYDESYSGCYKEILESAPSILFEYLKTRKEETLEAFKKANASGRMLGIIALGMDSENYHQELLAAFSDSSKAVKECLVEVISAKESFHKEVLEKLTSKKATERETAVRILKEWNKPEDREILKKALETEKSVKVSDLISDVLGAAPKDSDKEEKNTSVESFVKNITKGNRKKTLAWAFETPFSTVHDKEGREVSNDYMMALLLCYSTMSVPGISKDAFPLAEQLNPQELALFMGELFTKWVEGGAEAKKKWVLYASSIHGGADIVNNFQHYINEWPKVSRGAIAAEAVKALALNSSPAALLIVDSISRKFKFRQVKNAAGEALAFAAKQLGLTTEELADRIVPDLGFNDQMERIFDYGERQFKVYINQALEIEVYDSKDKKLKNLPAPGKRDDPAKAAEAYAEFKQMKKQMKTAVTTQKARLESALSIERKWKCENWKNLFIKNPIMHQFAISLIWGVYENGALLDTFRYMEDGSFNTVDEEEYELKEDCSIGLVHPIELTKEQKEEWLTQLEDYEITQSIEQLNRKVFEPTEKELSAEYLERFGGKVLNGLSLHGKLSGMGWYRGSVQDAGGYYTLYREDDSLGMGVELHFSGAYVGDENEDVTVYYAIFYKTKYAKDGNNGWTVQRGSYIYDEVKDEQIVLLKDVPKRYFSEIVYQLEKATASSTEIDESWRNDADWRKK